MVDCFVCVNVHFLQRLIIIVGKGFLPVLLSSPPPFEEDLVYCFSSVLLSCQYFLVHFSQQTCITLTLNLVCCASSRGPTHCLPSSGQLVICFLFFHPSVRDRYFPSLFSATMHHTHFYPFPHNDAF